MRRILPNGRLLSGRRHEQMHWQL
eukprot:COSAG06_NODE_70005_length_194_cov_52.463158_1_plen_23_part_01